ncbi:MAG: DUF2975 domain-containing protein [Pseudomonadota bacterium]
MLPGYRLPETTRKWCSALKWVSVLLGLLLAAEVIFNQTLDDMIASHWQGLTDLARTQVQFSPEKTRLLLGLAFVAWSPALLVLFAAFRLFHTLSKGDAFSEQVHRAIRFLGAMVMVNGLIGLVIRSAFTLALTYDNPAGTKELSIAFGSGQINYLLVGTLILILGHIFLQAVRISDENRQIV